MDWVLHPHAAYAATYLDNVKKHMRDTWEMCQEGQVLVIGRESGQRVAITATKMLYLITLYTQCNLPGARWSGELHLLAMQTASQLPDKFPWRLANQQKTQEGGDVQCGMSSPYH